MNPGLTRVAQYGASEVWAKPLAGGEHRLRDLWAHRDRGSHKHQFWFEVLLLRVK